MSYADEVESRARPYEESDVAILAAELGLPDDEIALDVLRRAWRAGFYRATIEYSARMIEHGAETPPPTRAAAPDR